MNSGPDPQRIRDVVRRKYAEVSRSAEGRFSYPTGRAGAEALGYDALLVGEAPQPLLRSFCGVGNPFTLGEIKPGSNVLDIGSGAGFDLYVAKRLVGEPGRICGIDLTPEMVESARKNLDANGMQDVDVILVSAEKIPFGSETFDTVISNGVINLSPDKLELFGEIFRLLKKGGRLQFADVVLENELPATLINSAEAWSQ